MNVPFRAALVLPLCAASALVPGTAFGLAQSRHQQITERSCKAAGLPSGLCVLAGIHNYTTDSLEFLKEFLQLARETLEAEKVVHPATGGFGE